MALPASIPMVVGPTVLMDNLMTTDGTGWEPGWMDAAPLDDGNFAVVSIVTHTVANVEDQQGYQCYKVSADGTVLGSAFIDTGNRSWSSNTWRVLPAGNGMVRVGGMSGAAFPAFTFDTHLIDFSGSTPTLVSHRANQEIDKGGNAYGPALYDAVSDTIVWGSAYNYFDTVTRQGVTVIAINGTTGDLVDTLDIPYPPWRGWGMFSRAGKLVIRKVVTGRLWEATVTLSGGTLSYAEVDAYAYPPGADPMGAGLNLNDWDVGSDPMFIDAIGSFGHTEDGPVAWNAGGIPGQIGDTIGLFGIGVQDWSLNSHEPYAWNAPYVWRIEAADWAARTSGFQDFTIPFDEPLPDFDTMANRNTPYMTYHPTSNVTMLLQQTVWRAPGTGYNTKISFVLLGNPAGESDPVIRTFNELQRSMASARLNLRKVIAAPVESVLNETPGKIVVDPGKPVPVRQIAIYPGERTEVFQSGAYVPPKFGDSSDPGLVQTWRGLPRRAQLSVIADTLCSTTGEFLSSRRDQPSEVELGTEVRWLAEEYDPETGRWGATLGSLQPWSWQGSVEKIELQYRKVRELFSFPSLSLDPGMTLTSDFGDGQVTEMTVSMVLMPRYPMGYAAIGAGDGSPDWHLQLNQNPELGTWYRKVSGRQLNLALSTPLFATVSIKPPVTTGYLSWGPGRTQSFSVRNSFAQAIDLNLVIGKRQGEDATANFELLELSIDTYARDKSQVEELNALYGQIYGSA